MLALFFLTSFAVVVTVVLLNPQFWKGYRNSKFIDEYLMEDFKSCDDKDLTETRKEKN